MALKISISGRFLHPFRPSSSQAGCPVANTSFAYENLTGINPIPCIVERMENRLLPLIDLIYGWCRTGHGWDDILRELVESNESAGAADRPGNEWNLSKTRTSAIFF